MSLSPALRIVTLLLISFAPSIAYAEEAARKVTFDRDVIYGHKAGMALTFDVIKPENANGAAVLFMVSGGWVSIWAPPETIVRPNSKGANPWEQIVDKGYTLFLVRHGSSPYFKVPDAVSDVRRAVRYIRLHADKWGIDHERIGVIGGSAGGHLTLMLSTTADDGNKNASDEVERQASRIRAGVAWFPPTDLQNFQKLKQQFPALDFEQKQIQDVSPLAHVTTDDAPVFLAHGDKDELVPLSESEAIVEKLKEAKVEHDLLVIPGAGQSFTGDGMEKVMSGSLGWFDRHLLPKKDK
jgi:acetyl esterase/lipase